MSGTFNSQYKGEDFDSALGIVLGSQVTQDELTVLNGSTEGVAVANKAAVVNAQKNFGGLNELGANIFTGKVLKLLDPSTDYPGNPPTGYSFLYLKNSEAYIKTSSGVVSKIGLREPKVFTFTDVISVICVHNFGTQYPSVDIIGSNDQNLGGQVFYQNVTTLIVSFNNSQSGRVIVRY